MRHNVIDITKQRRQQMDCLTSIIVLCDIACFVCLLLRVYRRTRIFAVERELREKVRDSSLMQLKNGSVVVLNCCA